MSSSSAAGGDGGGGGASSSGGGYGKLARTFKQSTLSGAYRKPLTLPAPFVPPPPAPPPPSAAMALPSFQKKVDKRKEPPPLDEKAAKANGIHSVVEMRDVGEDDKVDGDTKDNKESKGSSSSSSGSPPPSKKAKTKARSRLIDDEAEEGDEDDSGGVGGSVDRGGGSDSFVRVDEEWAKTGLQPGEFEKIKELEAELKAEKESYTSAVKTMLEISTRWESQKDEKGEALSKAELDTLRERAATIAQHAEDKQKAMEDLRKKINSIKAKPEKFIKKADEADSASDEDEAAVVENNDDADPNEGGGGGGEDKDAEAELRETDAALPRSMLGRAELSEKEEAKAAAALELARIQAKKKKKSASKKKTAVDDSDNAAESADRPVKVENFRIYIDSVRSLEEKVWSRQRKEEWSGALTEIYDDLDSMTKQHLVGNDYRYCYRYRTERGLWEVSADTLTLWSTDKKGRPIPLQERATVTVSAPRGESWISIIVYSGSLTGMYTAWEQHSTFGIGALNVIMGAAVPAGDARKACRLGLLLMLRTFQMRNKHSI